MNILNKKVEIRPIEEDKWHKQDSGVDYVKPKKLVARVKNGQYDVHFDEEELQWLKDRGYEINTNFVQGQLNPIFDSSVGTLVLENGSNFLFTDKPVDFIRYKVALSHPSIANSEEDLSKWPEALFIIYDEQVKINKQAAKVDSKMNAYVKLNTMSSKELADACYILFKTDYSTNSNDLMKTKLSLLIEDEKQIKRFLAVASLSSENFSALAFVNEAIVKGQLKSNNKSGVTYMGDRIGWDEKEAAEHLMSAKGNELYLRIKASLEALEK